MRIGIVTAFGQESKPLRSKLLETGRERIDDFIFFLHRYEHDEIVVVKTGQGQARGSMGTHLLVDRFNASVVFNCGVAGAIAPHRQAGDVVISERVIKYHRSESDWLTEITYFPDPRLLGIALRVSGSLLPNRNVAAGTILSGDDVVDSEATRETLWARFHGECVELEGAGVAKVCQAHRLPWIGIRGISDHADERVLQDFNENVELAALHSNCVTFEIIKNCTERSAIRPE